VKIQPQWGVTPGKQANKQHGEQRYQQATRTARMSAGFTMNLLSASGAERTRPHTTRFKRQLITDNTRWFKYDRD